MTYLHNNSLTNKIWIDTHSTYLIITTNYIQMYIYTNIYLNGQ